MSSWSPASTFLARLGRLFLFRASVRSRTAPTPMPSMNDGDQQADGLVDIAPDILKSEYGQDFQGQPGEAAARRGQQD